MFRKRVLYIFVLMICFSFEALHSQESAKDTIQWSYKIISDTPYHHYKRTVVVRLSERISEDELKALAAKIKKMDSKQYERTFITYYLPKMEVGHGAWASSHYDPNLKIEIYGTTKEQNVKMTNEAKKKKTDRDVIGTWYIEAPYVSRTIILFRKDNKVFRERIWKDGSSSIEEMTERKTPQGMQYQEIDSDSESDFYIINNKNDLEIHDSYGLVDTAKKI